MSPTRSHAVLDSGLPDSSATLSPSLRLPLIPILPRQLTPSAIRITYWQGTCTQAHSRNSRGRFRAKSTQSHRHDASDAVTVTVPLRLRAPALSFCRRRCGPCSLRQAIGQGHTARLAPARAKSRAGIPGSQGPACHVGLCLWLAAAQSAPTRDWQSL